MTQDHQSPPRVRSVAQLCDLLEIEMVTMAPQSDVMRSRGQKGLDPKPFVRS